MLVDLRRVRDGLQRLFVNGHGHERLHVGPRSCHSWSLRNHYDYRIITILIALLFHLFSYLLHLQYVKQEIFPPFPHAGVSQICCCCCPCAACLPVRPFSCRQRLHHYCYYYHRPLAK